MDTETTGFEFNELIQVAAVLFVNGEPVKKYNKYFLPAGEISHGARKIHGLTKEKLAAKGAVEWSKGQSEELTSFLNEMPDLPIVAHHVKYDYNDVLIPAFKKVGNLARLPKLERWRCTYGLSGRLPNLRSKCLDEVL